MSGHAEIGRLLAYVDGELPADDRTAVSEHLGECLDCRRRLEAVRARAATVSLALSAADVPAPTDAAWAALRSTLASSTRPDTGHRHAGSPFRWPLARAAGLVLLLAGGAAAAVIPGSPVRGWIFGDDAVTSTSAAAPDADLAGDPAELGAMTDPEAGAVEVSLTVPTGTEIVVHHRGARAGVFGPEGTRFASGAGRLEARASSGPVRVELPRSAASSTLRVNGRVVLTVADGRLGDAPADADGDLATQGSTLRFRAR